MGRSEQPHFHSFNWTQILKRVSTRRSFSYIQSLSCHNSLVLVITTEEEGKADQEGKKRRLERKRERKGRKRDVELHLDAFCPSAHSHLYGLASGQEYTGGSGVQKCVRLDQIPAARGLGGTGVQRNTFCECPSSTECRYSHTDTTWGD